MHNKPHICCTCQRKLTPTDDAIVYLGWGQRYDGKPGPGWVAALCAPDPSQAANGTPSPCVQACRDWATEHGEQLVPATYEEWLG